MKITGNEPVYPIVQEEMTSNYHNMPASMMQVQSFGLTIRQQFSMTAMQGILSGDEVMRIGRHTPQAIAEWSVELADALIAELNKEEQ